MDAYDKAQRDAGDDVKICPDCLEAWDQCTCSPCIECGEEYDQCVCEEEED